MNYVAVAVLCVICLAIGGFFGFVYGCMVALTHKNVTVKGKQ